MCNDFRFFTALRFVQNDRGWGRCVRDGREGVLGSGWQNLARVVSSEGRKLRSVDGGGAMSLDSSLRCAAFRMTGGGMLRCVRDGREGMLRPGWQDLARVVSSEGRKLRSVNGGCAMILDSSLRCAAFRMTGKGCCVRDGRMGGPRNDGMNMSALGMAGRGRCVRSDRSGVFRWWQAVVAGDVGFDIGLEVCFSVILP